MIKMRKKIDSDLCKNKRKESYDREQMKEWKKQEPFPVVRTVKIRPFADGSNVYNKSLETGSVCKVDKSKPAVFLTGGIGYF